METGLGRLSPSRTSMTPDEIQAAYGKSYLLGLVTTMMEAGFDQYTDINIQVKEAFPTIITVREDRSWKTKVFMESEEGVIEPIWEEDLKQELSDRIAELPVELPISPLSREQAERLLHQQLDTSSKWVPERLAHLVRVAKTPTQDHHD